jgi:hypothetical protein
MSATRARTKPGTNGTKAEASPSSATTGVHAGLSDDAKKALESLGQVYTLVLNGGSLLHIIGDFFRERYECEALDTLTYGYDLTNLAEMGSKELDKAMEVLNEARWVLESAQQSQSGSAE